MRPDARPKRSKDLHRPEPAHRGHGGLDHACKKAAPTGVGHAHDALWAGKRNGRAVCGQHRQPRATNSWSRRRPPVPRARLRGGPPRSRQHRGLGATTSTGPRRGASEPRALPPGEAPKNRRRSGSPRDLRAPGSSTAQAPRGSELSLLEEGGDVEIVLVPEGGPCGRHLSVGV